MKSLTKMFLALALVAGVSACSIDGETGAITIEPGCMILCG